MIFLAESVRGKNVLITGASSGIGEQMAYMYAQHGANVFITARREQQLQTVFASWTAIKYGPRKNAGKKSCMLVAV